MNTILTATVLILVVCSDALRHDLDYITENELPLEELLKRCHPNLDNRPPTDEEIKLSREIVATAMAQIDRRVGNNGEELAKVLLTTPSQYAITGLFKYAKAKPEFAGALVPAAKERAQVEVERGGTSIGRLVQCIRYLAEYGNREDLEFIRSIPESQVLATSTVRQAIKRMEERFNAAKDAVAPARRNSQPPLPKSIGVGGAKLGTGSSNSKYYFLRWLIVIATGLVVGGIVLRQLKVKSKHEK